jgi:uroporphyrin-3 C-methyltransferase
MTEENKILPDNEQNAAVTSSEESASQALEERRNAERRTGGGISFLTSAALVIAVLALLGTVWQSISSRHGYTKLERGLTERLEKFDAANQQSLALAKNSDERSIESSARTSILEEKLGESLDQQESLQTLYVELANNREERLLAEVEQLLIIANQQLQLAGNVKLSLLALQTADSRLQQLDSLQVTQLRKSVAQDIQRLQAMPLIDVVGMSLKLESLADTVDHLPLVSERHPENAVPVENMVPDQNRWQKLAYEIWQDFKSMIRIERIDRAEPPLLAPDQNFFLRENIKLRLLTARIALLQHDEVTYRKDLEAADHWLKAHFDLRELETKNALATIDALSASNIVLDVPDISSSLALVSKYKLSLERTNINSHDSKAAAKTPTHGAK